MANATRTSPTRAVARIPVAPVSLGSTSAPHLEYEKRLREAGYAVIAGLDEAGRGCLAGPVVAAAVVLPAVVEIDGLNDSKLLSEARRAALYEVMIDLAGLEWGIGICTEEEILSMNILRASQEAMRRAVRALPRLPDHAIVDGLGFDPFPTPMISIVHGDAISRSIAAASILAKVTRDRLMTKLDAIYPGYDFARNKGYGTSAHISALKQLGPCPAHRKAFAPVSKRCQCLPDRYLREPCAPARDDRRPDGFV